MCSHEGCARPGTSICYASCCYGETATCEAHVHREQQVLDQMGFTNDVFEPEERKRVYSIVDKLWHGVGIMNTRVGAVLFF